MGHSRELTDITSLQPMGALEMIGNSHKWPACSTDYTAGMLIRLGNTGMCLLHNGLNVTVC